MLVQNNGYTVGEATCLPPTSAQNYGEYICSHKNWRSCVGELHEAPAPQAQGHCGRPPCSHLLGGIFAFSCGRRCHEVTDEVLVLRFGKLPWRERQINLVQILIYSSSTASGPPSPAGEGKGVRKFMQTKMDSEDLRGIWREAGCRPR